MGIHVFYYMALFFTPLIVCLGTIYGVFQDRISKTKRQIICATIFTITAMFLCVLLTINSKLLEWELCYAVLICCMAIALCKYIFRCWVTELLFIFFIVKCYMDSLFSLAKILQYHIIMRFFEMNQKEGFCIAYGVAFCLSLCPMWLFVRKLLYPLINKTEHMRFWYLAWLVPLFYYFLYRFSVSPPYQRPEHIIEGSESLVSLIWITVVFLSLDVMVRMMLEATTAIGEQEKRKYAERQMTIQREQFKKIEKGVEYAKKLNHDQRHHFLAISGYAQNQDVEGLKKYLADYQDIMMPKEYLMVCDNYAIDAVAQHMLQRAMRNDVKIKTSIDIPSDCGLAQSDLVVIMGNLMENAVEACERQKSGDKFLRINTFWASEKVFVILLENSYDGKIQEKNGIFLSSKRNKEGIGTNSIKQIAEKYHGIVRFEYDDEKGVFKSFILLNL